MIVLLIIIFSIMINVNSERMFMFILNKGISIMVLRKYIGKLIIIYMVSLKCKNRVNISVIRIEF